MMTSEPKTRVESTLAKPDGSPAPSSKPLISLLLIIHLFFVVVSLSANFMPSDLQQRLLDRFAVYVRTFNFNLNYTPYYWTRGGVFDVDHRIEMLPQGADESIAENWWILPDKGSRCGERYKRYQRLAKEFALQAENDENAGRIAQSIGTHFSRAEGTQPKQIRSRSHFLQPMDAIAAGNAEQRNPDSSLYLRTSYAVNCIVGKDGLVNIVKIDEASQVARPATGNNPPSSNPNKP